MPIKMAPDQLGWFSWFFGFLRVRVPFCCLNKNLFLPTFDLLSRFPESLVSGISKPMVYQNLWFGCGSPSTKTTEITKTTKTTKTTQTATKKELSAGFAEIT